MTKEDKDLLLKDLCERLPYGVEINIEYYDLQGDGKFASRDIKLTPGNIAYCFDNNHWVSVKPYLRPMSSMTEEEKEDFGVPFTSEGLVTLTDTVECMDWLNAHHFDYRGLIEKGLALEAPDDMYKQ